MEHNHLMVPLGFTEKMVHAGSHICQIYSDESECLDSLLKFLLSGYQSGERSTCFSEKCDEATLADFFSANSISYEACKQTKSISRAGTAEIYFQNNEFDPDRMLKTLANYYQESLDLGYPAARVIGEMIPEIQDVLGGNRLLEYESRVSMLLRECPVTAVCQYNANEFDGATIMDVLKVHPQMIVRGNVVNNPYFISPEEYLHQI